MTPKTTPLIYKGTKKTVVTLIDGDEIRQRVFDPAVEDVLYVSQENAKRLVKEQPNLWEHPKAKSQPGSGTGDKAGDK